MYIDLYILYGLLCANSSYQMYYIGVFICVCALDYIVYVSSIYILE